MANPTEFLELLRSLSGAEVKFVLIGGVAANLQGSATVTFDTDICYDREEGNIEKLVALLKKLGAELRVGGTSDDEPLPFQLNARSIQAGGNFTFKTDLGDLDCIAWPGGTFDFDKLAKKARMIDLGDFKVAVASIDDLLLMKRKAGRAKDVAQILELEEIKRIQEEN